jgi:hypothetical protein
MFVDQGRIEAGWGCVGFAGDEGVGPGAKSAEVSGERVALCRGRGVVIRIERALREGGLDCGGLLTESVFVGYWLVLF